jgi:hypothetical protein
VVMDLILICMSHAFSTVLGIHLTIAEALSGEKAFMKLDEGILKIGLRGFVAYRTPKSSDGAACPEPEIFCRPEAAVVGITSSPSL